METELVYCFTFLVIAIILFKYTKSLFNGGKLPPSPPGLPILGHVHLLKEPFHRSLESLSLRYGPVLYLRLGYLRCLVVSSPQGVEECLSQNDVAFANRPPGLISGDCHSYDYTTVAWAPYGSHWRSLRRVATIKALSSPRLQDSPSILNEEVRFIAREMSMVEAGIVDLRKVFVQVTRNVMASAMLGRRWISGPHDEVFHVPKLLHVSDFFPVLRWVDYKGWEKKTKGIAAVRDQIGASFLEEARARKKVDDGGDGRKKTAMVEELLELQRQDPDYYTDDILKGIIMTLLSAGTDTTNRTMEWAMALLLNHPTVFHKARSEIDTHVGTSRLVDDSDLPNLPYLRCIIAETLRLFPIGPLLIPHYSPTATTVGGYLVPKGTIMLVNVWAIQRDPRVWEKPLEFMPERFAGGGDSGGYRYLPFGLGRRACPGYSMAMRIAMMTLATWIQCFEWESLDGREVDMEEEATTSSAMGKLHKLVAICKPRASFASLLLNQ